jgi:hypothetical protein
MLLNSIVLVLEHVKTGTDIQFWLFILYRSFFFFYFLSSELDHLNDLQFPLKMSQQETVTVRYVVVCGKPSPNGTGRQFNYLAQAPASLCAPHSVNGPKPDEDAAGKFIASLVDAHHDEIMRSRAWRCIVCDKPAKEILYSAVPFLSPVKERCCQASNLM